MACRRRLRISMSEMPELTVQIHQGLIADIAGRLEAALLIFRQGLSQTALNFLEDLLAFAAAASAAALPGGVPALHAPSRISFGFAASGETAITDRLLNDGSRRLGLTFATGLVDGFRLVMGFFFGGVSSPSRCPLPWVNAGRQKKFGIYNTAAPSLTRGCRRTGQAPPRDR